MSERPTHRGTCVLFPAPLNFKKLFFREGKSECSSVFKKVLTLIKIKNFYLYLQKTALLNVEIIILFSENITFSILSSLSQFDLFCSW